MDSSSSHNSALSHGVPSGEGSTSEEIRHPNDNVELEASQHVNDQQSPAIDRNGAPTSDLSSLQQILHGSLHSAQEEGIQQATPARPTTYFEGLGPLADSYPQLGWLHFFFHRITHRTIRQLDEAEHSLQSQRTALILHLLQDRVDVQASSRRVLQNPPLEAKQRIVLISFYDIDEINIHELDDICFSLDLDPFSIRAILEDGTDAFRKELSYIEPQLLQRRQVHFEVHRDRLLSGRVMRFCIDRIPGDALSAIYQVDQSGLETCETIPDSLLIDFTIYHTDSQLVILFCDDSGKQLSTGLSSPPFATSISYAPVGLPWQTDMSISEALHWSIKNRPLQDQGHVQELPLISLLIPYIELQLERVHITLAILEAQLAQDRDGLSLDESQEGIYLLLDIRSCLQLSTQSLQAFGALHAQGNYCFQPLVNKIIATDRDINSLIETKKSVNQGIVAMLSSRDAKKSIGSADAVKSLTKLAFVFIPMTFATSIFGANVLEFGSGTVSASVFALIVILSGVLSVLLSWMFTWEHKARMWWRFSSQVQWLFMFFQRSPLNSLFLALYCLLEGGCYQVFCELKVNYRLATQHRDVTIRFSRAREYPNLENYPKAGEEIPAFRRMKMNLLHQVASYTSQPGWENDRFYKPWIKGRRLATQRQTDLTTHAI